LITIELTKRGYYVVGFDLSEGQLRLSREKAAAAGVSKVDIFGCHIGQFSREHALTHDDFEMLVAAEKGE
jgi:hypothetical protein